MATVQHSLLQQVHADEQRTVYVSYHSVLPHTVIAFHGGLPCPLPSERTCCSTLDVVMLRCCGIDREGHMEWRVSAALTAGGVKAGDVNLHVGRHYSIRDLITWCNRMQVITLNCDPALAVCLAPTIACAEVL